MVAPRTTPDTPDATTPPTQREDEDASPYGDYEIDQTQARYDPDSGEYHLFTFHEAFQPKPRLSKVEKRELAIKQAALRIAAGIEMRSLRVLAEHIGCTHTAIDNALLRFCDALKIRKFHISDTTRQRQSDARRKQLVKA
jgi:hypothetical protein